MENEDMTARVQWTKEQFIEAYCKATGLTWEEVSKYHVCLPCHCDYEECHGWAIIPNTPDCIESQMTLYGGTQPISLSA